MQSIVLSKLTLTDKQDTFDLLQNKKVMRFLGPRRVLNEQEANDWFKNELENQDRFAFRLKSNQELIGFCGITLVDKELDFGYFIREKFWGLGLTTKMCELSINKLKETFDFKKIKVFIADDNYASIKIAQKLNWIRIKDSSNEFEKGALYQIP